jgi:hypothetical protein
VLFPLQATQFACCQTAIYLHYTACTVELQQIVFIPLQCIVCAVELQHNVLIPLQDDQAYALSCVQCIGAAMQRLQAKL